MNVATTLLYVLRKFLDREHPGVSSSLDVFVEHKGFWKTTNFVQTLNT